jgi:hypothetical protein
MTGNLGFPLALGFLLVSLCFPTAARSAQCPTVPVVVPLSLQPARAPSGMMEQWGDTLVTGAVDWNRAAYLADTPDIAMQQQGGDMLKGVYYGYDGRSLWLRLDMGIAVRDLATQGCRVSVFFSGTNDLVNRSFAEAQPGGPAHAFGIDITSKLDIMFSRDGLSAVFSGADGQGGWARLQSVPVSGSGFVEAAVPFALLGLVTGSELKFGVVGYCGGEEQDLLPDAGFASFKVPYLGAATFLKRFDDPRGDDYGPGDYVYPSDPTFHEGAFDITRVDVKLDQYQYIVFRIAIAGAITNPWGCGTGYSLQAVDLYIDTDGLAGSGARDLFRARKARTVPEQAWEYFVRAATDTVALYDASGKRLDSVRVIAFGDTATSSVFIGFPLAAIGPVRTLNVIVAMLGYDAYSDGGIRPVTATRGQWTFGGCDRKDLCPNIIDLVVDPADSQEEMLSSYRTSGRLAEVRGVRLEIP